MNKQATYQFQVTVGQEPHTKIYKLRWTGKKWVDEAGHQWFNGNERTDRWNSKEHGIARQ